jgi:hypothetical protein
MTDLNRSSVAVSKLESMINAGRQAAAKGLAALSEEWGLRHDVVVRPAGLEIDVTPAGTGAVGPVGAKINATIGGRRFDFTPHARGQLLATAGIPLAFADHLADLGMRDLLQTNLVRLLADQAAEGMLIREVKGTVKGVLSPSYKCIDSSPTFEAFAEASMKTGLVPYRAEVTETRAFMSFLRPEIVEITPGEHVAFGVDLRNSDYGNGALNLALFMWRLLCANGASTADLFRKVHLGRRFEANADVAVLSQRTIELDTKTLRSAVADQIKALPAAIQGATEAVRAVATTEVNLSKVLADLGKRGLTKGMQEKVKAAYENTALPVEALPQEPGIWRLSNVFSLLANAEEGDKAIDLRDYAGEILKLTPKAKA